MKRPLAEKHVTSARGTIFYWTNDIPGGTALVFLPGLTADHTLFESQTDYFTEFYRILVWDCPCHGKSRPYNEFSYSNVADELNRILEVEGIDSAVFIGQSFGGMIAQYFIDRHPRIAQGFISIGSVPFGDYYSKSDLFWLKQLEWMCSLFPDKLLRKSMAKMCGVTEKAQKRMLDMLSVYSKRELCHLMYIGEAAFIPENKNIFIPCRSILMLGTEDHVGKVASYTKEWAKRTSIPLIMVPDTSHNSNDDRPEFVNQIISDFVISLH